MLTAFLSSLWQSKVTFSLQILAKYFVHIFCGKRIRLTITVISYSEVSQTSNVVLFGKIVNGLKLLTIFVKISILDAWAGSKYTSVCKIYRGVFRTSLCKIFAFKSHGKFMKKFSRNLFGIYLLKVNNRNTRTRCEIYSELTIKDTIGVVLVSLLLTLNIFHALF